MSYADFASLAQDMLTAYGTPQPILMTIPATRSVDPVADTVTAGLTTTAKVQVVIKRGRYDPNLSFEANAMIRQNQRTLLVAGLSCPVAEIPPDTTFVFEGATWTAFGSTRLAPDGGQAILHTVYVKR